MTPYYPQTLLKIVQQFKFIQILLVKKLTITSLPTEIVQIHIYDVLGRQHLYKKIYDQDKSIELTSLKPGLYFLKLTIGNGETQKFKFIKK